MKKLSQQLATLPLFIAAVCGSTVTQAETPDWYQVEVLIFSQQDLYGDERHVTNINLQYPDNIRRLALPTDNNLASGQSNVENSPLNLGQSVAGDAFLDLPNNMLAMTDEHRRLNRAPGYRVLYHKAWRQPGLGTTEAPWVLIQGGETFGDHHELEGSVRLVRNRYLHFQANLWKTKFGPIETYSPASFPSQTSSDKNTGNSYQSTETSTDKTHHPEATPWPPLPNGPSFTKSSSEPELIASTHPREEGTKYRVTDITTLNQTSRISRQEYTYLDHPNMGVIIYVTKYEP
jgi:hypothetical protein